jgi:hypothetical protein
MFAAALSPGDGVSEARRFSRWLFHKLLFTSDS